MKGMKAGRSMSGFYYGFPTPPRRKRYPDAGPPASRPNTADDGSPRNYLQVDRHRHPTLNNKPLFKMMQWRRRPPTVLPSNDRP